MQNTDAHTWIILWCFLPHSRMYGKVISVLPIAVFTVQLQMLAKRMFVVVDFLYIALACSLDHNHAVKFIAYWYALRYNDTSKEGIWQTYKLAFDKTDNGTFVAAYQYCECRRLSVHECEHEWESMCSRKRMMFLLQKCGLPLQCRFDKKRTYSICHKKYGCGIAGKMSLWLRS